MRKRIEPTIVEQAIENVAGFQKVIKKLEQQVVIKGQSSSTLHNYIRLIASISLHFGKLPEQIDDDEINEYLTSLALNPKSPSRSNFKHVVYGLLYYFRLTGLDRFQCPFCKEGFMQTVELLPKIRSPDCFLYKTHKLIF